MELLLSLEAVDMEIGRTSKLLRASVFACNEGTDRVLRLGYGSCYKNKYGKPNGETH